MSSAGEREREVSEKVMYPHLFFKKKSIRIFIQYQGIWQYFDLTSETVTQFLLLYFEIKMFYIKLPRQ